MGKGGRLGTTRAHTPVAVTLPDSPSARLHHVLLERGWVQSDPRPGDWVTHLPLEPIWDYPPSLPGHRISEMDEVLPTNITYSGMSDSVQVVLAGFDYEEACDKHRAHTTKIPGTGAAAVDAVLAQLDVVEKHHVVVTEAESCADGDGDCQLD